LTDVRTNAELTEATASGLRWITLGRLGSEVLLLASMVVLARLIPPSAFGMFAVAVIVQELAIGVPSEGVGSALVQRRSVEREHLQGGLALSLAIAATLGSICLVAVLIVVRPIFGDETAALVALSLPWFVLGAVVALPLAVLRRRLDFRLISLIALTQSVVRSVTSIVLATAFGLDASALVLGGLAGMGAMVVLALILAPVPWPRWRSGHIRDLLPYGRPAALASLCWAGFRNGDYAIVGARLGTAQAGFYWRGFQLAVEYQRKVSAVMVQVAFPVLSRTTGQEAMFELRARMVRLLTVVMFPLLATLCILAPVLIPFVFGPAWEPAVLPTQILTGVGAATVVIDAVGTVLMASGRTRALLGYAIAHFAVYVGAILFASRYGLVPVCCAAVGVHLVFLVVAYGLMLNGRPERTLRFIWDDMAPAVVCCAALAAVAWPVEALLRGSGTPALVNMALVAIAAAAGYLAALRLWFPAAWRDLMTLLRRVLPIKPLRAAVRRVPLVAGRST
jgi:O-antigen/teichoic acid export membrane protein